MCTPREIEIKSVEALIAIDIVAVFIVYSNIVPQ